MQRRDLCRRRMRIPEPLLYKVKHAQIILSIHAEQLLSAKLQYFHTTSLHVASQQSKHNLDPLLSKHIYLACSKLALICADSDELLDWVVSDRGDLAVDAVAVYVVEDEEVWADARGEVVVYACLLAAQEVSHDVEGVSRMSLGVKRRCSES